MPRYRVNFYDCNDMQTWLADIKASNENEAYIAAEQYRKRNAIQPDITEVYSIFNLETEKEVYLSTRAKQ